MRQVLLNTKTPPLTEANLVNFLTMEPTEDVSVPMPLRLDIVGEYSPYAIYLDNDLGVWQIAEDEDGYQVLVCEKIQ